MASQDKVASKVLESILPSVWERWARVDRDFGGKAGFWLRVTCIQGMACFVFVCVLFATHQPIKLETSIRYESAARTDALLDVISTIFVLVGFMFVWAPLSVAFSQGELNLHVLWGNLLDRLPQGTFMISYSWSSKRSLTTARKIGALFAPSVCWLDCNELIPGENIADTCALAVRNSLVQFVFLSEQYVRSENCRVELREILKHPERAIVFVDTPDNHASNLVDGCTATELRSKASTSAVDDLEEANWTVQSICDNYGDKFAVVADVEKLASQKSLKLFVLSLLLDCGVLRPVFQRTSPLLNGRWVEFATRLVNRRSPSYFQYLLLGLIFGGTAGFLIGSEQALVGFHYSYWWLMLPVAMGFVSAGFAWMATRLTSTNMRLLPFVVHVLIVMHKLGLCDTAKVCLKFTDKNRWATQMLHRLVEFGVVEIQEHLADSDTLVFGEIDQFQEPASQHGAYFCDRFTDLTEAQRTTFAGHLIQETLLGAHALQEVIGIQLLNSALKGAKLVLGKSFAYHTEAQELYEKRDQFQKNDMPYLISSMRSFRRITVVQLLVVTPTLALFALLCRTFWIYVDPRFVILNYDAIDQNHAVIVQNHGVREMLLFETGNNVGILQGWDHEFRSLKFNNSFVGCTFNQTEQAGNCTSVPLARFDVGVVQGWDHQVESFNIASQSLSCSYNSSAEFGVCGT